MLCSLIDAIKGREVIAIDIKGGFLKAKVPEDMELIVKMDDELAELFLEINPKFKTKENGELYLKCLKALYGHIEAARLFYDELDNTLTEKMGFTRTSYDPCVYNRRNKLGETTTVRTHVDDLKVSSKSRQCLDEVPSELRSIYKDITVTTEQTHDYLGMVMSHDKDKRQVSIKMDRYIKDTIECFKEELPE
jgi:hypothetical protein